MTLTIVVFLHLIATCGAIGTIVLTDMRLLAKLVGYRVVIPAPQRLETVMISASLLLLYLTGAEPDNRIGVAVAAETGGVSMEQVAG